MKRKLVAKDFRWAISSPNPLILCTWSIFLLMWFFSPVSYKRELSATTLFFLVSCIGAFCTGVWVGQGSDRNNTTHDRHRGPDLGQGTKYEHLVNARVQLFSVLGLIGTVFILIDKLLITGLDFSGGLGELRINLSDGNSGSRSIFLWAGMAAFSFADVAVIIYILVGEFCSRVTAVWVFFVSFCPAAFAVLYGGRSSAMVLLFLVLCACLVRVACGCRFWPKTHLFKAMLATHSTLLVVGTLYVFASRGEALGYKDSCAVVESFAQSVDATVWPDLQTMLSDGTPGAELLAQCTMTWIYATHGLTGLDYLLTELSDLGPYYGAVQGNLAYKGVITLLGLPDQTADLEIRLCDHVGLFDTAWGGCFLDFGYLSPVFTFLLGILTGACYRFSLGGGLGFQMLLTFMYAFILFSPMVAFIEGGNSFLVLLCILSALPFLPKKMVGGSQSAQLSAAEKATR